jgi:diaminohydroxyphosphoribosylaminopyrimidine deaminase/5-amino-6-(5-phosphoribosylamino)uracil reductase
MTHVLLESGPRLLGSFFDAGLLDELHVFVAPKLVGGAAALSPVGGRGLDEIPGAAVLDRLTWRQLGDDLLLEGPVRR